MIPGCAAPWLDYPLLIVKFSSTVNPSLSLSFAAALALTACAPAQPAAAPPAQPSASSAPPAAEASPAAHGPEGAHGPDLQNVNYLLPEPSHGNSQSPINIITSRAVTGHHQIEFHYRTSREHVQNLGHTVKVAYDAGSTLEFDGTSYDLIQFHFHTPAEHLLDGITYPMEMHLVHAEHGRPDRLLVIGVLFKEGEVNGLIDTLLSNVPRHAGQSVDADKLVDARSVIQEGEGYYHYEGSLTTPPYTEAVTWLVLDQVHDASAEQIETLNRLEGNNARHIQELRARLVDHAQ